MDDLGVGFWLTLIGVAVGAALGGILIFLIMGWAWYAWGLLGMLLFLGAVTVGIGYVVDKRDARRRRRLAA
jgi:bacteriorhodopsin